MKNISIYEPYLLGNEKKYVLDCLDTNWISSRGKYVQKFEKAFSNYVGNVESTTCSNGTVALHLAILALGIGAGDEVIVPSFTYIASVNAIKYVGATPVFVDCNPDNWNMDIASVRNAISKNTKAIMCVHIYGVPCDIKAICEIAKDNNIRVIEDCAEALGSKVNGTHVGTLSDISTFSFFGNKTITTGEGGMVVSKKSALIERVAHLKSQSVSPNITYWHDCLGYNYRLTNIASAIGLAQLENIKEILLKKQNITNIYKSLLVPLDIKFQMINKGDISSNWLNVILMPTIDIKEKVVNILNEKNIEIRPAFPLVSKMPHYEYLNSINFPVGEKISQLAICLPSHPGLKNRDVENICRLITHATNL
jgi:perosamine synthetase